MTNDLIIKPMTEPFILWRCLHAGPLTREDLDRCPGDSRIDWERYRRRNGPLLLRLTRRYGACAILARAGDRIVGMLRFYPRAVCDGLGAGGLCLQQDFPSGPADDLADRDFPTPAQLADKTLLVHCLMTGSPQLPENPCQRRGLGSRLVRALIDWARSNHWEAIEACSFEDIPIIYEMTGCAGQTFWKKLGFAIAERYPHPDLQGANAFITTLREQAQALGISPDRATDKIVMRLDLTGKQAWD